jgi:hypothetical protein
MHCLVDLQVLLGMKEVSHRVESFDVKGNLGYCVNYVLYCELIHAAVIKCRRDNAAVMKSTNCAIHLSRSWNDTAWLSIVSFICLLIFPVGRLKY